MRPYIYYVPVAVFLLTAILTGGAVNLKDPRLVRRPGGAWSPFRLFRDEEWTPQGLVARRKMLRGVAVALGAGVLAWIVVLAVAGPG